MGGESSKEQGEEGLSSFNAAEKQIIKDLFLTISGNKPTLSEDSLQHYLSKQLPASLTSSLFNAMSNSGRPTSASHQTNSVTPPHFYTAVAHLTNGHVDQKVLMIRQLAASHDAKHHQVHAKDLFDLVSAIYKAYFGALLQYEKCANDWGLSSPGDDEVTSLTYLTLNDLFYADRKARLLSPSSHTEIPDVSYTDNSLVRWYSSALMFSSCFTYLFQHAFPVCQQVERSLLPLCLGKAKGGEYCDVMSMSHILAINQAVPYKLREKWTLLFDSRKHGESFTNLLRNVRTHKNTVIIVRDADEHIFGGFSTAVWSNNPQFQGSTDDFLFSLSPTLDIYRPSGLNTNYFYLNTGQETFPNGMGMGGQLNYFSLWLADEYGEGHSMTKTLGTTYHSPQLSGKPQFHFTDLQIWKCSNIQEDEEEEEEKKAKAAEAGTSILDKDPGAKAILEMVGKGNLSDGMRDSDPTASNPQETEPLPHHTLTG